MVDTEVLESAVALACRAPSLHNSQPWLWVADGGRLDLFVDVKRVLATDRSTREAQISCGAVLDHLGAAMAGEGWLTHVSRFPAPGDTEHLAAVEFAPAECVTDDQRRRADAIVKRRTNRLPFFAPTDWDSFEPVLRSSIGTSDVHLDVLSDDIRPRLAEAAEVTESLRFYDSTYHRELNWWTGPFEASEGIPYSSLVSDSESDRVGINRHFPSRHTPEPGPGATVDQSKILMLSTKDDSPLLALRCGEALSTVLLECTMAGLATCPVTHLTELSVSRELVAAVTDHTDRPQVLIRVGIAPPLDNVAPTPRRPLADVLRIKT
jgi:nitroreductase